MTKLKFYAIALALMCIGFTPAFAAKPNNVYLEIDGFIGAETVFISKSAPEGVVTDDSFLSVSDTTFDWDNVGATLGLHAGGINNLSIGPMVTGTSTGTVTVGWYANYVALGAGSIDLDIDLRVFAWLSGSIIRENVNSSANVTFVATIETETSKISVFDGYANVAVDNPTSAVLSENGSFSGQGVVENECYQLVCVTSATYQYDSVIEDVVTLIPGETFSMSVEAIAQTWFSTNLDELYDQVESYVSGASTLLSDNPTASFEIFEPSPIPIPAGIWMAAPAFGALWSVRRKRKSETSQRTLGDLRSREMGYSIH